MHRDYVARLEHDRAIVDPDRVLRSQFLGELGVR
jgi:hypothetical protein